MRYSRDIETLIYERLTESGYNASAHTLPAIMEMPHVHVVRTGGFESDLVVETSMIDFDVYAEDDSTAMESACELCGWVRDVDDFYMSTISTLPYHNHDPRHPTISRVTFSAQIVTRTV